MHALMEIVVSCYGMPQAIITVLGQEFNSLNFIAMLKDLDTQHKCMIAYQLQVNGRVERFHRTLKEIFSKLINNNRHLGRKIYQKRLHGNV